MRALRSPLLGVLILALSACGLAGTGGTTTVTEPTTTTVGTTTTTAVTTTTTTLPGEPIGIGPAPGDVLMVIGVSTSLHLRTAPGTDQEALGHIPPLYGGLIAAGETREIPGALWTKVSYEGTVGWVHMSYVGQEGSTEDATAGIVADLGETPSAETMAELGLIIAESLASEDPPSETVMVAPETTGDLGEVIYDVIGLGDDAVLGLRVHVFGEPVQGGFRLESVEVTTICGRGVTDEGDCV